MVAQESVSRTHLSKRPGRPKLPDDQLRTPRRVRKINLQNTWKQNFNALSEHQRGSLLAQQEEVSALKVMMHETYELSLGRGWAGDGLVYPDLAFLEIRAYLNSFPLVNSWSGFTSATLAEIMNEEFDDENFRQYGLVTRVWKVLYYEFLRNCLVYAKRDPDIDQEIIQKISIEYQAYETAMQQKLFPDGKDQHELARPSVPSLENSIAGFDSQNVSHEERDRKQSIERETQWLRNIDNATRIP
jgi:hypothetical protein